MPSQRTRRTETQWRQLIADQAQSGLSQEAYCQRHNLALSTFCSWRARCRDNVDSFPEFIELSNPGARPSNEHGWDIELCLGDGITLRLRHY